MSAMKALQQTKQDLYFLVNSCIDCPMQRCSDTCAMGLQMELDAVVLEAFEIGRDYDAQKDHDESYEASYTAA